MMKLIFRISRSERSTSRAYYVPIHILTYPIPLRILQYYPSIYAYVSSVQVFQENLRTVSSPIACALHNPPIKIPRFSHHKNTSISGTVQMLSFSLRNFLYHPATSSLPGLINSLSTLLSKILVL